MPRYFVETTETLIHHGFVEADSDEQAKELFKSLISTYDHPENYIGEYDLYSEGQVASFCEEVIPLS